MIAGTRCGALAELCVKTQITLPPDPGQLIRGHHGSELIRGEAPPTYRHTVRMPGMENYQDINRANWDERAPAHARSPHYNMQRFVDDPGFISHVVRFDRPCWVT
jgi:hypothetical protein